MAWLRGLFRGREVNELFRIKRKFAPLSVLLYDRATEAYGLIFYSALLASGQELINEFRREQLLRYRHGNEMI
jgi:hypothetical protein